MRETRVTHYTDGQVQTSAQYKDGKRDGHYYEFNRFGVLKIKQTWRNGLLDGQFEEFYDNGSLYIKGKCLDGKFVEWITYYTSGKIRDYHYFTADGRVDDIKRFREDGSRDLDAFPHFYTVPVGDTLTIGHESKVVARMVNVTDSLYLNGKLIIGTAIDTVNKGNISRVQDTIAVIDATNGFDYSYTFIPKTLGNANVVGVLLFTKETDEEIIYESKTFFYPYFVKEQ